MALIVEDKQSNFKYFCKICSRGFGCGRALGGHMRAHGICEEACLIDDDHNEPLGECDGKNLPQGSKHMYSLRTNPNRFKNCRICENCGKEFSSWKSFLSHDGKCNYEDVESNVSSPISYGDDGRRNNNGWSKRKRSPRTKIENCSSTCPSSEEEDLAKCLIMLSNSIVDHLDVEPEESCASASKEYERREPMNFMDIMASRVHEDKTKGVATNGLFECKACKKVFTSHQALGGHRASHKKVKGCFASRLDQIHDNSIIDEDFIIRKDYLLSESTKTTSHYDHGSSSKRKSKIHECSVCHRIFTSGQALGGHKRCHWITSNSQDTSTLTKLHQLQDAFDEIQPRPYNFNNLNQSLDLNLDLNLPTPSKEFALRDIGNHQQGMVVSPEIYLKSWLCVDANENGNSQRHHVQNEEEFKNENNETSNCFSTLNVDDDEADSNVKLAKLNELKDVNDSKGFSHWLQVGVGSTTDLGTN